MLQTKALRSLSILIIGLSSALSFLTGCNKEEPVGPDGYPPIWIEIGYYIFEDKSGAGSEYKDSDPYADKVQCFQYDGNEHTITLRLKSITKPGIPIPENFLINYVCEGIDEPVNYGPYDVYQSDGFCKIWTDRENDDPVIKIKLEKNRTREKRLFAIEIAANPAQYEIVKIVASHTKIFGAGLKISQSPLDDEPETYSLKAQ